MIYFILATKITLLATPDFLPIFYQVQTYDEFVQFLGQFFQKVIITLQKMRIKTNLINQTCFSLKSMMQYSKTTFSESAIFSEKNLVENRVWPKV